MGKYCNWVIPAAFWISSATVCLAETLSLSVRQHKSLPNPIDDSRAEEILARINEKISESCDVSLKLHDPVSVLMEPNAPFSINSQSNLNFYKTRPGSIDIVGEINWCGVIAPNIRGCANTPGRSLVVVRMSNAMEPVLWAHELMHTTGSRHRDVAGAIMRPMLGSDNFELNEEECTRFKGGSPAVESGVEAADFEDGPPMSAEEGFSVGSDGSSTEPVLEFIENEFPHGTPYSLASRYADEDVDVLRGVLLDANLKPLWSNAVATLGAIGTERSKAVLLDFLLSSESASLSAEEYLAKSNVPIALGWSARRSIEEKVDDRSTIELLLRMTNADWWTEEAKIEWSTTIHSNREDLITSLVVKSFSGLSLTGSPEGEARLKEVLSGTIEGAPEAAFTQDEVDAVQNLNASVREQLQSVSPLTRDAIDANGGESFLDALASESARVKEFGLSEYYQ